MKKQTFLSRRTTTPRLHKNKMLDESPQRKLQLQDVILQPKTILIKDSTDAGEATADTEQPISQPFNFSSRTTPLLTRINGQNQQQASSLDSSMALTILVLLTALFFMGFFSLYLRRFSTDDHTSRRRRLINLPSAFSVSSVSNQKGKGLDVSTVRSLPLVSYGEDAKQGIMLSDCPICLTEFEKSEIVKIIPHCRHVFHPKCIDTWLVSHVSCPFCRSTIFFKDEDGSDVKRVQDNNGVVDTDGGSTVAATTIEVEEGYTCTWREVGIRRICSWTRLEDRVVLQRSFSF